jgi:hypothetical protein
VNLHQSVYALLEHVSNKLETPLPLIFAYQNAERVLKPYGSIRVDTINAPQHEITLPVLETGYQVFGGWRRAVIELQVYGRNAGTIARRFALSLASYSSNEFAASLNVAVAARLFLGEVPELLNLSQYEERGIYQFALLYSDEMDDHVGLIERVEIGQRDPANPGDAADEFCTMIIEAYPPYTPEHPAPSDKE